MMTFFIGMKYMNEHKILKQNNFQLEQNINDLSSQNDSLKQDVQNLSNENDELKRKIMRIQEEVNRGTSIRNGIEVEVTAYTLSTADCGKSINHPGYGLTANGTNLAGQSLWSARAIAVDPNVIPLGSKVQIAFKDEAMKKYNGVYTACDTGSAIKGNVIDLFAGDGNTEEALKIGRRKAIVKILK